MYYQGKPTTMQYRTARFIVWMDRVLDLVRSIELEKAVQLVMRQQEKREPTKDNLVVAVITDRGVLLKTEHHGTVHPFNFNMKIHQTVRPFLQDTDGV